MEINRSTIASKEELVVFAAVSLTDAFEALGVSFGRSHPEVRVVFNFAGSQQLAQQLSNGAPADVFAAANERQMTVAVDAGRVAATSVQPFVRNRLVVVMPVDNPAELEDLGDLAKPGVKLVLADPAVPVGEYSLAFLARASQLPQYGETFSQAVLANVVSYEENVKAVLGKITLGEADAGIVYVSDIGPQTQAKVARIHIPDDFNVLATYPLAPVNDSRQPELAQAFVAFVLSPVGQQILEKYGFVRIDAP